MLKSQSKAETFKSIFIYLTIQSNFIKQFEFCAWRISLSIVWQQNIKIVLIVEFMNYYGYRM